MAQISVLFLVFLFSFLAQAQVEICNIAPGTRAKDVTIGCEEGEVNVTLDANSGATLESDQGYRLEFKGSLFNSERTVHILDRTTQAETMTIQVNGNREATIEGLVEDRLWVFNGLATATLSKLSVTVEGSLVVTDSLELEQEMKIEANSLYFLNPFTIKNGTFRLKFEEGLLGRMTYPFYSRVKGSYSIIKSSGAVKSPSRRRANLDSITNTRAKISVLEMISAWEKAYGEKFREKFKAFSDSYSEADQESYLKKYVFSRIKDNKLKGKIGENIYREYLKKQFPGIQYMDPKVGVKSFDSVHIKRTDPSQPKSAIQEIVIGEVKYATGGNVILGVVKKDGQEWRQLSLPYVKKQLEVMAKNADTTAISEIIQSHPDQVKLELAVFDPQTFQLTLYSVGDLKRSSLD